MGIKLSRSADSNRDWKTKFGTLGWKSTIIDRIWGRCNYEAIEISPNTENYDVSERKWTVYERLDDVKFLVAV